MKQAVSPRMVDNTVELLPMTATSSECRCQLRFLHGNLPFINGQFNYLVLTNSYFGWRQRQDGYPTILKKKTMYHARTNSCPYDLILVQGHTSQVLFVLQPPNVGCVKVI